MKILVVDATTIGQAAIARRIQSFDPGDLENLDVELNLAGEGDFMDRVAKCEVLIIGSGLQETAKEIARKAKAITPNIEVLMFVTGETYSAGAFRAAHVARVRKVLSENASPLDILQELVAIQEEFRVSGRAREGRVTVVVQPKGGLGATTICAALAEVSGRGNRATLLWDLDIESRDLTRSLNGLSTHGQVMTSFINGSREVSRPAFRDATVVLNDQVSILQPPSSLAEAMELVGTQEGVAVAERVLELARASYDNIIVDTAGKLGPLTGYLMCIADTVVVLVDDSVLGVSAVHQFLVGVTPYISTNLSAVRFLRSGTSLPNRKLMSLIDPDAVFPEEAWLTSSIPVDSAAGKWPGTGKTIYSCGGKVLKKSFEDLTGELGLLSERGGAIHSKKVVPLHVVHDPGVLPGSDTFVEPRLVANGKRSFFSF